MNKELQICIKTLPSPQSRETICSACEMLNSRWHGFTQIKGEWEVIERPDYFVLSLKLDNLSEEHLWEPDLSSKLLKLVGELLVAYAVSISENPVLIPQISVTM